MKSLRPKERRLLENVNTYLERGRELKRWWEEKVAASDFAERFELTMAKNRPETSWGFFDKARLSDGKMAVMGNYQEMFYDRPKSPARNRKAATAWTRDQLRQFVLRYFMRVSDFQLPRAAMDDKRPRVPSVLRPFSLWPPEEPERRGFGFSQLYFKRQDGEMGAFPEDEREAVVDLRRLGEDYEWIVAKVRIFDFEVAYRPFGTSGPSFALPVAESSYLVLHRDFVRDEESVYGLGYAFVKDPETGILAYGPGEFDAAIELIDFHVEDDGKVKVAMTFVANRPKKIANLSLDPITWGRRAAELADLKPASRLLRHVDRAFGRLPLRHLGVDPVSASLDAANLLTGGQAAKRLGLSRRTLEKEFLLKHFQQHHQTVAGSLHTWRQVPDWLDDAALPEWVTTGRSS